MTEPRLTIVIPTYNRPDLLPRAIKSCLDQVIPVKIIIADDGDDTEQTAKILDDDFSCETILDGTITHLKTEAKTAWQNWRAGAEAATTEFVSWHQDDDVVRPTYSRRIITAFDRFPDANIWISRLHISPDGKLALWSSGNGPWVPMDLIDGDVCSYAEGSIIASTGYFTAWSLAPAMAFRNGPMFKRALEKMPDDCDIFVERLVPAMACNGGPFIADPIIAGYWVIHDEQLSTKQHPDQPRQTKLFIKALDDVMDGMERWEESLAAWCQINTAQTVIQWAQQIDTTIKEGGVSRHARKVQAILVHSLIGRVKMGRIYPWWHKAARWVRDRVAI